MKTVNLQPILEAVRNIERQELASALKAHGGHYAFNDDEKRPSVEYWDEYKGPLSGDVDSVSVAPDGANLTLTVTDGNCDTYNIDASDVYPGCLGAVTAALPELKKK